MFLNYVKLALRNIYRDKIHSSINITGLSIGMAVAMLIGLWIRDELSFNKYHRHYNDIAQVMQQQVYNGSVTTDVALPMPLDAALRNSYGSDFRHIVMSSWTNDHILTTGDKQLSFPGNFMSPDAAEMFTLHMLKGTRNGLSDPSAVLISQKVATSLFGDTDPINQLITLDNKGSLKVTGVYEDLPRNTTLKNVAFIAPWNYYVASEPWIREGQDNWNENSFLIYVQMAANTDMATVSQKIKNIKLNKLPGLKPVIFLQPMSKWHLFSEFKDGINTGGDIQYVWLFGIIGLFVLLLACINFMNLSTARSEKRAKEVGLRKAIGAFRSQLIIRFFCESLLFAVLSFVLAIVFVMLALPFFNQVADKEIMILWTSPLFWMISAGFTLFTGLIAGSYPAFYLTSFQPVKVLKGTFKAGRFAAVPRKVLVVVQFTVSVVLIIGTIIVFKQIQFAKNRPVGYSRDGLIHIEMITDDLGDHFHALKTDLLQSGAVASVAASSSPATEINNTRDDITWKGKDPGMTVDFANIRVTTEFGKTMGWQFVDGRDFSTDFRTDSTAVILNEAAVKYMGLENPVGQTIRVGKRALNIIGVTKDMVMQSPYIPVKQTIFYITGDGFGYVNIRINPDKSIHDAINTIASICKTYSPSVPFSFKFVDEEYAKKFAEEERIGKLASFFSILAIFISCLGLFGMATFMAEQRIKEIGVRKVLGASVFNLWGLLSKDFIILIVIALFIAIPFAYYAMNNWLQHYQYRSGMPWWIFAVVGAGAILIALLTVSYQSIHAALMNPVKSLRAE
ncbi:ABC transporter permease [Chitinophaga arvensicola]|uniref:MacB-like core domain-containing protein n=1 Tax=Chitinophaga arvensicola TaxID=29529 RepID=A0A1I0SAW4_9BACT|nr:ABC transporter permease [Chitinophaga arvensicola]SEW53740.1 MacB-like core domain-containing protein [Chitinophaga arvensicola]